MIELFTKQQKDTIYTTISNELDILKKIDTSSKYLSKNKKDFISKITNSYHNKSYNQFTYFLKNIASGINSRTSNHICNLYDKYNNYKFTKNIYLANDNETTKLQEVKKGQYLDNKQLQYANKKVAKALYIEHKCKDKNRLFITFTLPSQYHYYTKKGTIKNPKCIYDNYENSIVESLKLLNTINRNFTQKINIQLKRYYKKLNIDYVPYQYIKVLEFHFSMTGHSHMILYCDDTQLKIMQQVYYTIVKKYKLKKVVIEVLENKKASSYVYKYLLKNSLPNNKDNSLFNKYKSYFNKIRIFSSSNFEYTNQSEIDKVYKYISANKPELMKRLKKSSLPLYVNLENMIKRGDFLFEYEIKETTVIDKKLLSEFTNKYFHTPFLNFFVEDIYSKALYYKSDYIKQIKIKTLCKVYYNNKYTTKKELIYDKDDFIAVIKTDFKEELLGIYCEDIDF